MEYILYGLIALVAIYLVKSVSIVPQSYQYTVERFGRYIKTLDPGLHIIIPFADSIGAKINMKEIVHQVPSQDVITKDNAVVSVDGVIYYQIHNAAKAAYEVDNLHLAIINLTMTNIRTVMGSMDLDELLSHREQINAKLLDVMDGATTPWGTKVTRVEIKDIHPPADLVASMGRQMKAEREKRAQILEAEGLKQSAILKADGEKRAAVLESEGRLEAAQRDAEARERLAKAEANATEMVAKAVREGGSEPLKYFISQKYVEAFGKLATSQNEKIVLMPYEATGLLSSLEGIKQLLSSDIKPTIKGK